MLNVKLRQLRRQLRPWQLRRQLRRWQLRWSWNIDHVLLIDEIAEVEWHGGARCTVHYHATHSSLEHQTLAWTLAFAKQHEAATWVSVLRLLMRVDAARHGLDLQQRTRLKTAFKRAAKASNTLTVNQQYQFFEHLNLDLRQAHAGAQLHPPPPRLLPTVSLQDAHVHCL